MTAQYKGPAVAGFVYGSDRGKGDPEAAYRRLGGRPIPVGNGVTSRFPWMRTIPITLAAGARNYIQRAGFQPGFANETSRNVYVHEVRITQSNIAAPFTWLTNQTDLRIRMGTSSRQIIEPMFPWQGLQTEMNRFLLGDLEHYTFTLPAPYFLQRSHPFMIDVLRTAAMAALRTTEDAMYLSLHGVGAHDDEPIDLVKAVMGGGAAGAVTTVTFDENRDSPLRDAWIDRIGFASGMLLGGQVSGMYVRPRPPEGLAWHRDEWFMVGSLADQVGIRIDWIPGVGGGIDFTNPVLIHRPKRPYVIEPAGTFYMELWNANAARAYVLDVGLLGTQDKPEGSV